MVDDLGGPGRQERVLHVTPCQEPAGTGRKNRDCILILTDERLIISPLPESAIRHGPKQGPRSDRWQIPIPGSEKAGSTGTLQDQYRRSDPAAILEEEKDARGILYKNIQSVIITRVRRYRHHLLLFPFMVGIPENARYHVDYQLTVKSGETVDTILTPFSLETKEALTDVLGSRVREEIDDHAPLL